MIHLLIGSTGAGKTTYAIHLAKKHKATRFAIDDWMNALFFPDISEEIEFNWATERINRCEQLIWNLSKQLLSQGQSVILEISMSTKEYRTKQINLAKASGHPYQLHYLNVDRATRLKRVLNRNKHKDESFSFEVTEDMFNFVENMFENPDTEELKNVIIVNP